MAKVYYEPKRTKGPNDPDRLETGEIPQVAETYAFLNAAYPIMNEHQLAIGETTIGSRRELMSENGIIDAPELYRLVLERAKTAREAIRVADELTKAYGYNDWGECFTFADTKEVWHFEIHGPGKGKKGAVWAAQRVPDDEIGVSANAGRIREIDLSNSDYFMASANVTSLAEEMGYWSKASGKPFEFTYAYDPDSRTSLYCRRREWRVLSLLAPSLKLNPESENYPFSVKPDKKVSVADVLAIFRDTYGGTEYDMTRTLTAVNRKGETVKSPVATPFMNGDTLALFRLKRERTICSPAATYLQITQSRDWLPGPDRRRRLARLRQSGHDPAPAVLHRDLPDAGVLHGRRPLGLQPGLRLVGVPDGQPAGQFPLPGDVAGHREGLEADRGQGLRRPGQVRGGGAGPLQEGPEEGPRAPDEATPTTWPIEAVAAYWKLGDDLWLKYSGNF